MTNKEKYKQAFDTLSASDNFSLEVDKMSILNRKHKLKTIAATVATCLIVTAGTGTAYASDLGGIQRKVQLWIHGDQTTATLTINSDGSYTGTYADKDGKNKEFGGGGIAINQDGSERSLTQEEIIEELNAPDIEYEKDGSVILYYKNQSIFSPGSLSTGGNLLSSERPTIADISSFISVSLHSFVITRLPSLSTDISSHILNISSILCDI